MVFVIPLLSLTAIDESNTFDLMVLHDATCTF